MKSRNDYYLMEKHYFIHIYYNNFGHIKVFILIWFFYYMYIFLFIMSIVAALFSSLQINVYTIKLYSYKN